MPMELHGVFLGVEGLSGSRSGVGSDSWIIWATSKVDFRADVLSNPLGYTCSIYPVSITVRLGSRLPSWLIVDRLEETVTYTIDEIIVETRMGEYTRTVIITVERTVVITIVA